MRNVFMYAELEFAVQKLRFDTEYIPINKEQKL